MPVAEHEVPKAGHMAKVRFHDETQALLIRIGKPGLIQVASERVRYTSKIDSIDSLQDGETITYLFYSPLSRLPRNSSRGRLLE
jgi:hypothetical protein